MTSKTLAILCAGLLLAAGAGSAVGGDWPEWCGQASRNMAAQSQARLPDRANCGTEDGDPRSMRNVKWVARIGQLTTGSPVVSRGRVFIGTTWEDGKEACFLCLDEATGRLLGTFLCPRPPRGNLERWAISSTPTVDGDRLYFVSPYQEAMCIDLKLLLGQGARDQGIRSGKADKAALEQVSLRSILWRYDLWEKLQAYYHHTASSSVLVHGDYVYVCTGNGRSWVPGRIPFNPLGPSLVVFHKITGQLVARDDEQIGQRLYRGQYSSPSLGIVSGRAQVLFATGDGLCYAFEPVDPAVPVVPDRWTTTRLRGPIVYFIDVEDKDTGGLTASEYARSFHLLAGMPKPALPLEFRFSRKVPAMTPVDTVPEATVPDVPVLKKIWWFDCIPPAYKKAPFYPRQIKGDGLGHPCDIIGTPVFSNNRVYIAIGGDPNHGGRDSKGSIVCIDATKTGDVTQQGKLWSYEALNQSVSTVAVAGGLVFVVDNAFTVHCLDADNGTCYWTHATRKGATCFSSPLVADGKLYLGKTILAASKTFKLHEGIQSDRDTTYSSHSTANGVLFAVLGDRLWAISNQADAGRNPAAPAAKTSPIPLAAPAGKASMVRPTRAKPAPSHVAIKRNWPNLRGPFGQGIAHDAAPPASFDVAAGKNLLWKTPIPRPGASSPVVWEGRVFLSGADETAREVYCFDANTGTMLWRQTANQPAALPKVSEGIGHAASTGATDGKRYFAIFSTGDLVAVDFEGTVAWTRALGTPKSSYGYASSLIAYKHLFVQVDDSESATLYALDPATGKSVWQKKRALRESWASPIIAVDGGRAMVVLAENPTASAYDVDTGEPILSAKCLSGEVAPSPAYARGTMIVANERAKLSAISLASGKVAWSGEEDLPDVASPLATEELVFTAASTGVMNCYDLRSGQRLWTHEFEESFYPSPLLAAGRIYALDNAGTMHVFRASKEFAAVADSKLREETMATPAFAGGKIFIRGKGSLYCVGTK